MAKLEFFYDLSSPWTRIAFHNVQPILAEAGAEIVWRPFLVGGVFNAVNDSVYAGRANPEDPKLRHTFRWMREWAALAGVPMNFPSRFHPLKSVKAMRFCCALEEDQQALFRFSGHAFDAYFSDKRNLDESGVLIAVANECGFDGEALSVQSERSEIKDRLRANTQEAIDRGAYGSPTMFVDGEKMYFGNDQLPLVRRALASST